MLDYIKSLGDDRRNLVRALTFIVLIIMLVQDCGGFQFCAFLQRSSKRKPTCFSCGMNFCHT